MVQESTILQAQRSGAEIYKRSNALHLDINCNPYLDSVTTATCSRSCDDVIAVDGYDTDFFQIVHV